jgi:hypothetical protein
MQSLSEAGWVAVLEHAVLMLTQIDSPCVYDLRKNKPGIKTGVIEGLNRRVGT